MGKKLKFNIPEVPVVSDDRKAYKKQVAYMSWGLIIYSLVLIVCSVFCMFAYVFVKAAAASIAGDPVDSEAITEQFFKTDGGMICGVIMGGILMLFWFAKRVHPMEIFDSRNKMTLPAFIMILCVLMSLQQPAFWLNDGFEFILNKFGLSGETAMENATSGSESISMFLYGGFVAPFAEELIYRGLTMGTLRKISGSKTLAIVVSAMFFGIMHANPIQSVYAACAGIVFGYAAMEYGIHWSMLLHLCNNLIFGDGWTYLMKLLPEKAAGITDFALFMAFLVAGIVIVIIRHKRILGYIRENNCPARVYGWTFTSIPLLIFFAENIVLALMQIEKL